MEDSTLNEFWSEHNTFSQCFSSAFLNETGDPWQYSMWTI